MVSPGCGGNKEDDPSLMLTSQIHGQVRRQPSEGEAG